jgi:hypothetical protein
MAGELSDYMDYYDSEKKAVPGKLKARKFQIEEQMNIWFSKLNKVSGDASRKFELFGLKTRDFFRELTAGIENVEKAYNSAIASLEKPLSKQRGIITAAEDFYGSSSELVKYESNKLTNMEKANRPAKLQALINLRAGLAKQLEKLQSNNLYKTAESNYTQAKVEYDKIASSGNYKLINSADRKLDEASKNLEKFTKQEAKLVKDIEKLDNSIEELNATLNSPQDWKNKSRWSQFTGGMSAAASNWREERKGTIGEGWLGNFGADLTKTGLDELETGFKDFFTTVIDGSKDAGDAFKDMSRQMLTAIRDVALQKAATAIVSAIPLPGMASGGLVMGPMKNRDSVPTMLMPGEFVMKKSAVDALGADYLSRLNNSANSTIASSTASIESAKGNTTFGGSTGAGGVVNVYVVGQQQQQQMTPNDVVVTITNDMLKGGQTKKLVKQIAMGGI